MDVNDWADRYYEKTGENLLAHLTPLSTVLFDPEHGVLVYEVHNDRLFVKQLVGDGRHWEKVLSKLATTNGCVRIRMYTSRNPKCFERKYGYKQVGYVMEKEV